MECQILRKSFDPTLAKLQLDQSRVMASLATKLRLTPSTHRPPPKNVPRQSAQGGHRTLKWAEALDDGQPN